MTNRVPRSMRTRRTGVTSRPTPSMPWWCVNGRAKDYGPGGKTVFLTNVPVEQPLQPFDDDDDRRLMENCRIKEAKQPWDLGHPPQKSEGAVRVHVVFTLLMFALATAYRQPCEREARGGACRLPTLVAPALGAAPNQGARVCPRALRALSSRRRLAAVGSEAQRYPARHWQPPAGLG